MTLQEKLDQQANVINSWNHDVILGYLDEISERKRGDNKMLIHLFCLELDRLRTIIIRAGMDFNQSIGDVPSDKYIGFFDVPKRYATHEWGVSHA